MKFSHKLMIEATMFYENNVLEGPKIDGQESYRCFLVFKNAQYDKDSHEANWDGRFLWKKIRERFSIWHIEGI